MGKIYGCKVTDLVKSIGYELTQKLELITDYTDLYLTGSRFFDTATEKSDWDFIVKLPINAAAELPAFVRSLGFERQMKDYTDKLTSYTYTLIENNTKIDLQFLLGEKNVKVKLEVQDFIKAHYNSMSEIMSSKILRKELWNVLIKMKLLDNEKLEANNKIDPNEISLGNPLMVPMMNPWLYNQPIPNAMNRQPPFPYGNPLFQHPLNPDPRFFNKNGGPIPQGNPFLAQHRAYVYTTKLA